MIERARRIRRFTVLALLATSCVAGEPETPGNSLVNFGISRQLGTDEWRSRTCDDLLRLVEDDRMSEEKRAFDEYADPNASRDYPYDRPELSTGEVQLRVSLTSAGQTSTRLVEVTLKLEDDVWKICAIEDVARSDA